MERIYNVPLRREFSKVPNYKKTKKAMTALRAYLVKHMKSDDIKIDASLNQFMWKHGIRNPPHHVKLKAVKDEKTNIVTAYLVDEEVFTNKVLRKQNKYTISDKKPVEEKKESNKKTETKKVEDKKEEKPKTTTKKETTKKEKTAKKIETKKVEDKKEEKPKTTTKKETTKKEETAKKIETKKDSKEKSTDKKEN